jgi:hypothetical protein
VRWPEKIEQSGEGFARWLRGATEVAALEGVDKVLDDGGDVAGRSSSTVMLASCSTGKRNVNGTSAVAGRAEDVT